MGSRRKFIQNVMALPLLGAEIRPFNRASKPVICSEFNSIQPKIKLSINAWSYYLPLYRYINNEPNGMSLFDLLEECARLNVDAVDPTGYFFPGYPEVPSREFINKFKKSAFQLGLDISGTGIRNDFATADKEKRDADIALAKKWIETAAEMGAPVIRVFAGPLPQGHSWDEASSWLSESLWQCANYGKENGVMIGVQNHGDMLKSADEVLKILSMVNSEWLGAIIDTGFFLTEDPYDDIRRVLPYAVNWQVKELLKDRRGGRIDMVKLIDIIQASKYRGYVPIETLPLPGKEDQYDASIKVPELLAQFMDALNH